MRPSGISPTRIITSAPVTSAVAAGSRPKAMLARVMAKMALASITLRGVVMLSPRDASGRQPRLFRLDCRASSRACSRRMSPAAKRISPRRWRKRWPWRATASTLTPWRSRRSRPLALVPTSMEPGETMASARVSSPCRLLWFFSAFSCSTACSAASCSSRALFSCSSTSAASSTPVTSSSAFRLSESASTSRMSPSRSTS